MRSLCSSDMLRHSIPWKRMSRAATAVLCLLWRGHTVGLMFWLKRKKLVGS